MLSGKRIAGLSILVVVLAQAGIRGGDMSVYPDAGLVSLRRNAVVTVGGELRVDYDFRRTKSDGPPRNVRGKYGDLSIRHANLRLRADVNPNVSALFKIDLSAKDDVTRDNEEMLEEAMLVMRAVGGAGLGFFAGKGKAPYGQDITIGILQSYHHAANRVDSAEGRVFIVDPPDDFHADPANPSFDNALPPMRPGQFDRTYMAGVSYEVEGVWKVEVAAFQPNRDEYDRRLVHGAGGSKYARSDIGLAARVWWSPVADLTVEASGMVARSQSMGYAERRLDLAGDARAVNRAYAVSAGFDWRPGPWHVFGEYQHAWDWNFSKGYDTNTWQIGVARMIGDRWRIGAMAEHLRIDDRDSRQILDSYWKYTVNVKYTFADGLFLLVEYGREWLRRDFSGALAHKRRGDYIGMRLGFTF